MGELDDLAAAANYHAPRMPAVRQKRRRTNRAVLWICLGGGAFVAILVAVAALRATGVVASHGDPGLVARVRADRRSLFAWFEMVNKADGTVTIKRVRINDEWDAPLAEVVGGEIANRTNETGTTLTIGEAAAFYIRGIENNDGLSELVGGKGPQVAGYTKAVIYVDVTTSRGRFRWRDGRWE